MTALASLSFRRKPESSKNIALYVLPLDGGGWVGVTIKKTLSCLFAEAFFRKVQAPTVLLVRITSTEDRLTSGENARPSER